MSVIATRPRDGLQPTNDRQRPPLIELAGVKKVYRSGNVEYPALRGVDLTIEEGDLVAIVGPSGSGKSTIMNMITGIDRPSAGTVTVNGRRIDEIDEEDLAIWRGRRVGLVFQFFQLLPTLTALENAMLPLDFSRHLPKRERRAVAARNLELVGLADKADNLPSELSGGQQQRVAIARALAADPPLLIGDEPTGNLDTHTTAEMFELLQQLNADGTKRGAVASRCRVRVRGVSRRNADRPETALRDRIFSDSDACHAPPRPTAGGVERVPGSR
jgi:putative ABC transport system ATP-binding protein